MICFDRYLSQQQHQQHKISQQQNQQQQRTEKIRISQILPTNKRRVTNNT